MSDVAKTPREELECKKKYLYEYSMFFECNDGSKCQILEDDVCDLLNEQQATINQLQSELELTSGEKLFSRRELERKVKEQEATINKLKEENEQLRRLFEEMKQPITINLTEEDEKELRKLLGLIDDE